MSNKAFIATAQFIVERALYMNSGMTVIHWDIRYPHQQKITKYCLTASSGGIEYGTTVVW
jgi:hypothetical protein